MRHIRAGTVIGFSPKKAPLHQPLHDSQTPDLGRNDIITDHRLPVNKKRAGRIEPATHGPETFRATYRLSEKPIYCRFLGIRSCAFVSISVISCRPCRVTATLGTWRSGRPTPLWGQRFGEVESLGHVATDFPQLPRLLLPLHPLGHDFYPQGVSSSTIIRTMACPPHPPRSLSRTICRSLWRSAGTPLEVGQRGKPSRNQSSAIFTPSPLSGRDRCVPASASRRPSL